MFISYFYFISQNFLLQLKNVFSHILAPPRFTLTPFNQQGLAGTNIELSCRAIGYPPPAITWQKNGQRLPSDGRYVILPSGQLRISRARVEDEGQYECSAFNVIGVVSTTSNLTIKAISKSLFLL